MKKIFFSFCLVAALIVLILKVTPVYSDELDDINKKLAELQSALTQSQNATAPLLTQLNNLRAQLTSIEKRVAFIENDISEKRKIIARSTSEKRIER